MGKASNVFILCSIFAVSTACFCLLTYMVTDWGTENDPKCDSETFKARRQAHRGYILTSQENTIEAIQQAFTYGYEPQFDVRSTRDGHLVLFADRDGKRMVDDGRKVIHELTLEEVQELKLVKNLGDKTYFKEGEIPTYEATLAAICTGNENAVFQATLHARDASPSLSDHDKEAAQQLVQLFKDSPCTSDQVVFGTGQPDIGATVRDKLEELELTNPTSFYMEPNTWVLGEAFWIRTRKPFVLAKATILEFEHVFWANETARDSIVELKKAGWCMAVFGKNSRDEMFDASVFRANVPLASWDQIGDDFRNWQNQTDIEAYSTNEDSFLWVMILCCFFFLIMIIVLPNLIVVVMERTGAAKIEPYGDGDEEAPAQDKEDPAPKSAEEKRASTAPPAEEEKQEAPTEEVPAAEEEKKEDAAGAGPKGLPPI